MKTAGRTVDDRIQFSDMQGLEGGIHAVVDNAGLSGVSAVLVIIDSQPGVFTVIIDQKIVTDPVLTHPFLNEIPQIIGRKLGNHPSPQSQHSDPGRHIHLRASGCAQHKFSPIEPLVEGRGQTQHNLSQCQKVKRLMFTDRLLLFSRSGRCLKAHRRQAQKNCRMIRQFHYRI